MKRAAWTLFAVVFPFMALGTLIGLHVVEEERKRRRLRRLLWALGRNNLDALGSSQG